MKNAVSPKAQSPTAARGWEAQYERDYAAQTTSGPITFTEEQRRKNKEVLSHVSDLLPFPDIYKASDCDLIYRFLIGKHWNVGLAEKGLRDYVELRKKDKLDSLIGEQLHPTIGAVLCPCYSNGVPCPIYGLDKDGLPILWLSPDATKLIAAMKQFTDEELLRGQMRAIELGRYVCRARGVDRCTYVIDLGGITMSSVNKATLGFLKGVMNMLQVAYPEIMRRLLIFNTGWAVSAAWKVLRPFVDVRVQDKIKFESKAPTLAALQPYMAADQVHPAFGSTGKENVLDALIEAEVRRIRQAGDNGGGLALSGSASPLRAPSATVAYDDGSLFDIDPHALHSFYCPTPGTACPTPSESYNNNNNSISNNNSPLHAIAPGQQQNSMMIGERMLIGAPRAVSAWMANMEDESGAKDALDMSLSVASSSNDYTMAKSVTSAPANAAEASTSRTLPGGADGSDEPTASRSRRVSTSRPAALATAQPATTTNKLTGGPCRNDGDAGAAVQRQPPRQQLQPQEAVVVMALTYGADGSITGYCGDRCVGQFRNRRLYAEPRDLNGDSTSSNATSPSVASPGALPTVDLSPGSGGAYSSGTYGSGRRHSESTSGSARAAAGVAARRSSQSNPPIGELLYEAGHPIHNFFIVCDGQRNARYLLRRSRLRTRLSVYNVVGGAAPVRTEKNSRHYVEGERAKLGVAVPSTDPASNSKGDWMLFGEDVTQRTPGQQLKHLFSKTKRGAVPTQEGSGSGYTEKGKDGHGGWPASMFAAMGAATSPSKRKARAAAQKGQDDVSSAGATSPRDATRKPGMGDSDNNNNNNNSGSGGAQLLAENKGQTVYFYNLLTRSPTSDLFALAVAITLSWSGELESLKDKSSPRNKRYVSDDEDLVI